eukprot:c25651_g1_i1.p1 GENE.c25651_g1_i1~~c25651_g1_i1.p1  ORF type:complete len:300 (-),score=95.17 c25651_g1_i1:14-868(-)
MSGTGMKVLVAKLRYIQQLSDPDFGKKKKGKKIDPSDNFAMKKKEIADELKKVRDALKERDALLGKHASASTTVELSAKIRGQLKEARANAVELEGILANLKKKAGKKATEEQQADIQLKEEQIEAVHAHIEEVNRLEKRRHNVASTTRDRVLGSGVGSTALPALPDDPTMSGLEPIDDETQAELQAIEQRNNELDRDLDEIAEGVVMMREIALAMGRELDVQNQLLDEVNNKADSTNSKIKQTNKQLTKILNDLGTDKMCTYIILIVLILFLVLFVYNKSNGK